MKTINNNYCGNKTGTNMRIDWYAETLCLPDRSYFDESVRNVV